MREFISTLILVAASLGFLYGRPALPAELQGQVSQSQIAGQLDDTMLNAGSTVVKLTPQTAQADSPLFDLDANHGAVVVGILGAYVEKTTGQILAIYPGSDLQRFRVNVGDYVICIDGGYYTFERLRTLCHADPGTMVNLVIQKPCERLRVNPRLVDSRLFVQYDRDGYFTNTARESREW